VRERPIPTELVGGDYQNDAVFRERFQAWMNAIWAEKDATVARLKDSRTCEPAVSRSSR